MLFINIQLTTAKHSRTLPIGGITLLCDSWLWALFDSADLFIFTSEETGPIRRLEGLTTVKMPKMFFLGVKPREIVGTDVSEKQTVFRPEYFTVFLFYCYLLSELNILQKHIFITKVYRFT
jgi:hypothetical protein